MNKIKSTKGITLISLVVTIIILLILAGVTIATLMGDNGLITRANDAKIATEIADIKEQIQTEILGKQAGNQGSISDSSLKTILEKYGTINYEEDGKTIKSITTTKGNHEIAMADIWSGTTNNTNNTIVADGSWNGTVNTPKIDGTGLTAVYWNGTEWTKLTGASSQEEWNKWYDYSKQNWANAQSADGSMWVWIPRYEYYLDGTNKTITINFIPTETTWQSTGYTKDATTGLTTTTKDGKTYILHPAFENGDISAKGGKNNGFQNGEWDKELSGFWVAKYVAGYQYGQEGATVGTVQYSPNLKYTTVNSSYPRNYYGTITANSTELSYPVFKANTYAYNCISAGDAYLLSQEIDTAGMYGLSNVDSHMVKNSEWGAVAYLTHSQCGVNGNSTTMNEVTINSKNLNNNIKVNNATDGNTAFIYAVTSYGNSNGANDVNASSTKNMTGVFDLNGCVWERVAGYYKGGSASTADWHSAMASSSTTASTKYLTLYTTNNKKGDAANETSGWNSDYSSFVSSSYPVFDRGGNYSNGAAAGVFACADTHGFPYTYDGFRVCLAF